MRNQNKNRSGQPKHFSRRIKSSMDYGSACRNCQLDALPPGAIHGRLRRGYAMATDFVRQRAMDLGAGGARRARSLSCLAKKGNPKKATRDTRPAGSLRFSKAAAAAELANPCGLCSNSPRRLPRSFLRCSALLTGARSWWRKQWRASIRCFLSDWKPLWYWAAGKAVRQYQSGLQGRCFFVALMKRSRI